MIGKLILNNLRCLREHQEVPLKPITLLVGENSTGKSTFLAAVRLAHDMAYSRAELNFKEEPFDLGAFDQIASCGGKRAQSSTTFTIGSESEIDLEDGKVSHWRLSGIFAPKSGQPQIVRLDLTVAGWEISASPSAAETFKLVIRKSGQSEPVVDTQVSKKARFRTVDELNLPNLNYLLEQYLLQNRIPGPVEQGILYELNDLLASVARVLWQDHLRPYAFAPIRSRPSRTYDPGNLIPDPQGGHVPILLAQTVLSDPSQWQEIRKKLLKFGRDSGLFTDIKVWRRGKSASDPFQILVKVVGAAANLIDVGYGVSQVLPVLVDSIVEQKPKTFLMQQPEVHLHPKAQAELGTFLGYLAKKEKKQFIVETHSDYLLDRICLDIRDRKNGLQKEDVQILFFQRKGSWVHIEPIDISDDGIPTNVPAGYREFFLKEQARLFGV